MTIRTRQLLSYAVFAGLLALALGGASLTYHWLGEELEKMAKHQSTLVEALTQIGGSIDKQGSLITGALAENQKPSSDKLASIDKTVAKSIDEARSVGGDRNLGDIASQFERYRQHRDDFLAGNVVPDLRGYHRRIAPLIGSLRASLSGAKSSVREQLKRDRRRLESLMFRSSLWLGLLIFFGFGAIVWAVRSVHRHLIFPLDKLLESVRRNSDRSAARNHRIRLGVDNELSELADLFNGIFEDRQRGQRRLEGRLKHQRQLVLGLLHRYGKHTSLFDLGGRRIAVAASVTDEQIEHLADWIRSEGATRLDAYKPGDVEPPKQIIDVGNGMVRIELLTAGNARPVGWLVRPVRA